MDIQTLVAFQDELTKIAKSLDVDKDMSFFERHPKKILGGAALATGLGAYMLTKGRKKSLPSFKASTHSPSAATSKAPSAASSHPPKPKAPAKKLSLEEAKALKYPGAEPIASHVEKHPGEAYIQAVREEGKRRKLPEDVVRKATRMKDLE